MMVRTKKKLQLWQKITLGIVGGVLALLLILGIVIFAVWHNELSTLISFEQIRPRNDAHLDGSVYLMEVKGDFYLGDFVEQGGAESDS